MLGVNRNAMKKDQSKWGYRNYYCTEENDEAMSRLVAAGLVVRGLKKDNSYLDGTIEFHATIDGCILADLSRTKAKKVGIKPQDVEDGKIKEKKPKRKKKVQPKAAAKESV